MTTLSKADIRHILMENGFTIKPDQNDLKDYVFEAVEAVLRAQAESQPALKRVDGLMYNWSSDGAGVTYQDLQELRELLTPDKV